MTALSTSVGQTLPPILEFTVFWVMIGRFNMDLCYMLHALGAVTIGGISLTSTSSKEDLWLEDLLVKFSLGYFLGHGFEMIRQGTATRIFVFHHLLAITLLVGVLFNPDFIRMKATSHVLLTEFSTPFLWAWEKHPSEGALGAFVVTYFFSRGLYLGHFVWRIFFSVDPSDIASQLTVGKFHYITLLLFVLNMLYFSAILVPSVPGHLKHLREERTKALAVSVKVHQPT